MTKYHILQIGKFYPPHMGGIETHLQTLCNGLRSRAEVAVIVANDGRTTEAQVDGGISVTRVGKLAELKSTPVCPGLTAHIRQAKADIIHLHLPNPAGAVAWLSSRHGAKLVVTYHSDVVRQKTLGRMFEPILNRVLSQASAIIVTSPNYLATSEPLKAHQERCRIIPYGIPTGDFERSEPATAERIKRQYGPRIIIAVGRLVYYKGFQYAIRAMRDVDAKLLIIGDGPLRAELEREARRLPVPERVVFLGEVQNRNIGPYYQAADVFAFPSVARSEAFGIVQLEAMMCGLPVINTSLDSGVPFVSKHGQTGITVAPRDCDSLASAMKLLLEDANMRGAYAMAARKRVREEFSASLMTQRTLDLYSRVMGVEHTTAMAVSV
jgi:glycosyltransferase involved in cell wall biosynthesis